MQTRLSTSTAYTGCGRGPGTIIRRAEILGRPKLYGTTRKFLAIFGLNSLKDLPKAEELKNSDRG